MRTVKGIVAGFGLKVSGCGVGISWGAAFQVSGRVSGGEC